MVDNILGLLHAQIECRTKTFRLYAINSTIEAFICGVINNTEFLEHLGR